MENEMLCFDLEDVIFVINKWDIILKNERDEDSSEDVKIIYGKFLN